MCHVGAGGAIARAVGIIPSEFYRPYDRTARPSVHLNSQPTAFVQHHERPARLRAAIWSGGRSAKFKTSCRRPSVIRNIPPTQSPSL